MTEIYDHQDGGDLRVFRTIAGRVQAVLPDHVQRDWDDYTKLKWLAANVSKDTKQNVRVFDSAELDVLNPLPDKYGVTVGNEANAARFDFAGAWTWLTDFREAAA